MGFVSFVLCLILDLSFSLLLSNVPTPSFIIDVDVLQKITKSTVLPSIFLPKYNVLVYPVPISTEGKAVSNNFVAPLVYEANFSPSNGRSIAYLQSKVITVEEKHVDSRFIAELDLPPSLCRDPSVNTNATTKSESYARLVQGLTNDRVGSYYWARSTGLGSSMMAIGVQYGDIQGKGVLRWEDDSGKGEPFSFKCNSNDGQRSEWVECLRLGDTVQLVPFYGEEAMMNFLSTFSHRVYGVQIKGRPLGSEPLVVCEWKISNDKLGDAISSIL